MSYFVSHPRTLFSYSLTISSQTANGTLAVDMVNSAQRTQGRAQALLVTTNYQGLISTIGSYPYFNGTFTLTQPQAAGTMCTFQQGITLASIFDFSRNGWLSQADQTQMPNGDTIYSYYFNATPIAYVQLYSGGNAYLQYMTFANVSLLVESGSWHPNALNISQNSYPYMAYTFSDFSTHLTTVPSAYWAPPADTCLTSPYVCNGSWPIETAIVYRSHDNSSYAHVLENANTATAAGECYFACNLSPGPYVTQFQVRLSTKWNAYSECNGINNTFAL